MSTWLRALNFLPLLKLSLINKGILIKKQQDFENILAYNKEQHLCPENRKVPLSPTFKVQSWVATTMLISTLAILGMFKGKRTFKVVNCSCCQ